MFRTRYENPGSVSIYSDTEAITYKHVESQTYLLTMVDGVLSTI